MKLCKAALGTFLFLLLTGFGIHAQTIQIGSGNLLRQGLPLKPVLHYSYSQQIYYASEIGISGLITGISFQYDVHSADYYANNCAIRVWMGHTSNSQIDTWISADSLELVFEGIVPISAYSAGLPGTGWMHLNLDSPFEYSTMENLVIATKEDSPGRGNTQDDFFCTAQVMTRAISCSATNDFEIGDFPVVGTFLRQALANLRIEIVSSPLLPSLPEPANAAMDVSLEPVFSWLSVAQDFDFYFGTDAAQMQLVQAHISSNSFQLSEPLEMMQRYYWRVLAHHGGESFWGELWWFETSGQDIGPPKNFQAWYEEPGIALHWEAPEIGEPSVYLIYKDNALLTSVNTCDYMDYEVYPGATYSYYIKASNSFNQHSEPTATLCVTVPYNDPNRIIWQDFESLQPWSRQIPNWIIWDLDNSPTWAWENYCFPHEGEACGWMVFSPNFTTPPHHFMPAHSGQMMLMSPDAINPPDDNWLISPSVFLGYNPFLKFWARSATDDYGLERLRVLISTGDLEPSSFTALHAVPWLNVPAAWTLYEYDLSAYQNQNVRLAWQAISNDALALFLDDIEIRGNQGHVQNEDELAPALSLSVHPNPCKGSFKIHGIQGEGELKIYDIKGRLVQQGLYQGKEITLQANLASGIYWLQIKQAGVAKTMRLVLCK